MSANKKTTTTTKRSKKDQVAEAVIHIATTFSNTMVTVTSKQLGEVLAFSSSGSCGFKGARKSTPFAAQQAVMTAVKKAMTERGIKIATVYVRGGNSPAREAALRALATLAAGRREERNEDSSGEGAASGGSKSGSSTLRFVELVDITRFAHNGCRPRKRRRV